MKIWRGKFQHHKINPLLKLRKDLNGGGGDGVISIPTLYARGLHLGCTTLSLHNVVYILRYFFIYLRTFLVQARKGLAHSAL